MGGMKCKRRKRLVQGKDFDAWAWKYKGRFPLVDSTWRTKPKWNFPSGKGKWVPVKFVEVK